MRRVKAILVHGTFASDAAWDDPDAKFSTRLRERLAADGAELVTEEFQWSGENSHEARRIAAEALAEKLRVEGYDGADELYLVGHSHGGTVTRLALNKLEGETRPTGVFTLGAPFVRFKRKAISTVALVITALVRALALVGVLMLARIFYVQDWIREALGGDWMMHMGATVALGAVLAWFLAVFCPSRLRRWAEGRLTRTQDAIVAAYDPPEKTPTPFICFRAVGDEAGLLLRFWSFFTWVLQTGVLIMVYGAIILMLIAAPMLAYQAAMNYGVASEDLTRALFSGFVETFRAVLPLEINDAEQISASAVALQVPSAAVFSTLAIFGALMITALVSTPVTVLAPWLLRRQWFAFGGEKLLWNLAAEIQVDWRANTTSKLRYVFLPSAYFKGEIQHNYYYFSDAVIDEIANRILRWRPPPARGSLDLERAVGRVITFGLLVLVVASAAPFTWVFAELMTEPPIIVREDASPGG